jgi:protein associated with RNAse G/E
MARRIHVDFRKWPDTRHWQFEMDALGEDEHGLWLWRGPGWIAQRGREAPIVSRHTAVKLLRRDWWTAIWNDEGPITVYVDVIAPGTWDGDRFTMIDLDLDVVQRGNGAIEVHDEDEFEEHRRVLGYPEHLVDGARDATAEVVGMLERGAEPFASAAHAWLDRARRLAEAADG